MRGGRPAGRILVVAALVALPLVGVALLTAGPGTTPAAAGDAVLRLAPGQDEDARAVRPAPGGETGARAATGARDVGLLAVLLAAAAAMALAGGASAPALRIPSLLAGRGVPATGRGPPRRSSR